MTRKILTTAVLAAILATGAVVTSIQANAAAQWRLNLPQQTQSMEQAQQ